MTAMQCPVAGWWMNCHGFIRIKRQEGKNITEKSPLKTFSHLVSYDAEQMDLEIARVARELYKAFSGMNEEFKEVEIISMNY